MKQLLVFSSLLLLSFGVMAQGGGGQDKGNGGFLYSRTSKKLLDNAQSSLLTEFAARRTLNLNPDYSSPNCRQNINLSQLENVVKNLSYSYNETSVAVNPEGIEENRYFHLKGGKIEATQVYFQSFVETYFRYSDGTIEEKDEILKLVRTPILHEGLHLFNYNELESRECAPEIEKLLSYYNDQKFQTLLKRIQAENDEAVLIHMKLAGCDSGIGQNYYNSLEKSLKCTFWFLKRL